MKKETGQQYCWTAIGIRGNRSCPKLAKLIHCHNCPDYEAAGRRLLDREPPQAYLEELTKIIAEPERKPEDKKHTIAVFRLGAEWLALPVDFFAELTRLRPIRRVPHRSNQIFLGLVSIRGDIQLCFSLGGLLGVQPAEDGQATPAAAVLRRLCVADWHNKKWTFPADEVYGLWRYADDELQPVPVNISRTIQKYTLGIITVRQQQTGLLNSDLVFAAFERSLA